MTCKYTWKSKLGPCIQDFIAFKRSNGFLYDAEEYQLHRFDDFCYNLNSRKFSTTKRNFL